MSAFRDRVIEVKDGEKCYGDIAAISVKHIDGSVYHASIPDLVGLQTRSINENPTFPRVFFAIEEKSREQPYVISLRAIRTLDFLTTQVAEIPWETLTKTAEQILEAYPNVSRVYFAVTPTPPGTIKME